MVTAVIAIVTVALGNVNVVARIVSMFFMVTYGALCAISFLEHFAARPSYRPSFRSKWYPELLGSHPLPPPDVPDGPAVCRPGHRAHDRPLPDHPGLPARRGRRPLGHLPRRHDPAHPLPPDPAPEDAAPGLAAQRHHDHLPDLRPVLSPAYALVAMPRYGFGTYLHFIQAMLNRETFLESQEVLDRLIEGIEETDSAIYVDTIISPSMASALAQTLQVPGVSGMENNTILFEFSVHDSPEVVEEVVRGCHLASAPRMNRLVLRHSDHFFGNRKNIHLWLTWHDYRNANLMILLSYILLGHPDWDGAEIHIFAAFPHQEVEEQTALLNQMISEGRLPISVKNLQIIPTDDRVDFAAMVERESYAADLVVLGLTEARLREKGAELLLRHPVLQDVLFVSAEETIFIE